MKYAIAGLAASATVLALSGCATVEPTQELVDARRAYAGAEASEARTLAPDRLLAARQALDTAEREHQSGPGSSRERDLAYIAQRRAELATAYGVAAKAQRDREAANERYVATEDRLRRRAQRVAETSQRSLESTQAGLVNAAREAADGRDRLRDRETQLAQQKTELESSERQLAKEHEARIAAEQRASAALASLERVANVKEDARGTVITLQGAVLFASGTAELLPISRESLDQVAEALKQQEGDRTIVVEGHTDSRGPEAFNLRLSEQRAASVREYLLSRGLRPERITAVGRGELQPIAGNDTPEGRANNRRVEIILRSPQEKAPR